MKTTLLNRIALLILIGSIMGCSKNSDIPDPVNDPEENDPAKVTFRFKLQGNRIPDLQENENYFAVISLEDYRNEPVWTDKTIDLESGSKAILSEELVIEIGEYSISKLIVYNRGSGLAEFAAPRNNSPESQNAGFSLPGIIEIAKVPGQEISMKIVKVPEHIRPELFGYCDPEFGENRLLTIRLKSSIMVGDYLYDHLQANVRLSAVNSQGHIWEFEKTLIRGINEIDLPQQYESYTIKWSKWDVNNELIVHRADLSVDTLITLTGSKPLKLIRSQESFLEIENEYYPESRTLFTYDTDGKLIKREYYKKLPQYQDLQLQIVTNYLYNISGNLVRTVARNPDQSFSNETVYDWFAGKIQSINSLNSGMIAEFLYDPANSDLIHVHYNFSGGQYFHYGYQFLNGNKIEEIPTGGNNTNSSHGLFTYDDNINPFYLWGITDEYLRYTSRNNEINAEYSYAGGFPVFIPDVYFYTYDQEGYPVELIRTWKTYQTEQFGYREKIIYNY